MCFGLKSSGQSLRLWNFCPGSCNSTRETFWTRPGLCSISDEYPLLACCENSRSDGVCIRRFLDNLGYAMDQRSMIFVDRYRPPPENAMRCRRDEYNFIFCEACEEDIGILRGQRNSSRSRDLWQFILLGDAATFEVNVIDISPIGNIGIGCEPENVAETELGGVHEVQPSQSLHLLPLMVNFGGLQIFLLC